MMKKLLLLLIGGGLTAGANAQSLKNMSVVRKTQTSRVINAVAPAKNNENVIRHNAAKTTASCFLTQTFGTGLPTGWTTASTTPAGGPGFIWKNTAPSGTFSSGMGVMHSTTASDGWLTYDSDSIAGTSGTIAPMGYLQTGAINCSTHSTVRLNFQNYFEKFNDSCFVWVSTTSTFAAGTYTSYPVLVNNQLSTNNATANAVEAHINITATAGSQPAVYIRFVYMGPTNGGYSWMIDDFCLSELDPVDVDVTKGALVYNGGTDVGFSALGSIPVNFAPALEPIAFVNNFGSTAEPTTTVNAKIFNGASSVYDHDVVVNAPVNALDTLADFTTTYTPTATGMYTVPFKSTPVGTDADLTNQNDTTYFRVTDTTWSENLPISQLAPSLYVHRPASGSSAELSFSPATQFSIPAGKKDTLSSVSVAFANGTTVGQVVGVQIFHFTPSGTAGTWDYDGTTVFRALTSSDITGASATSLAFGSFRVDAVASGHQLVLDGGTAGVNYVAVVKGNANTGTVLVAQGENPAPFNVVGYVGLEDTSNNDGSASQQFGQGHLPFGNSSTPFINLNFGIVDYTAVNDINTNNYFVGTAYPNPANSTVNVPFTMHDNTEVSVTLSNVIGQVIATQTIRAVGGVSTKASFATANLAEGVYLYTVSVNGMQKTGRVSITH